MLPGQTLVLFLLIPFGLLSSSPLDSCPDFCSCEHFLHLNCSSAGLSLPPQNIHTSISELDLSNNQLGALTFKSKYYNLHKVWLGNNSITHLSLCLDSDLASWGRSRRWRRGCLLWAPTLQLLSAERNQLQKLPEGLGQQRALHVLNLSFNKISNLEPDDFSHLKQLEELHLQNNLIAVLQPRIFEKLNKLKVLDLSFNLLTTLHPSTYISLRGFGTDVALRGNCWICDCNMRFLQRGMDGDSSRGLKTWSIECTSPSEHSGVNLLELQEDDLKCPESSHSRQLSKDITVPRGSEILLTCSERDAVWWTPKGQTAGGQEDGGLLIPNFTEQDEGLYVCLSQSHQIISSFNVQIHPKIRKSRSVLQETPNSLDKMVQPRNTVTQSRFALAVSLSVIITFIVAFILGVLLQPYICICFQKIKTRKQKPQASTFVPNGQQEQYVNEAYLHCEDVDDIEPHRERRVTFTEYTEERNMQYYDTVAGNVQEGNGAVIGPGQASSDSSDESGNEDASSKSKNVKNLGKKIEFEHIPDSTERNSLSSQSSNSSKEDRKLKKNCSTPNTSQIVEEQVQHTAIATIDVPQISIESRNELPGFSSEPFADWSPHQHGSSLMDPDFDNGDQFEFSDSVRSGSPISPSSLNGSLKQANLFVPKANKKIRFKSSSSSSDISDDEPTHYTVNADSEEEAEVLEKNVTTNKTSQIVKSSSSSSSSDSETEVELQKEKQTLPITEQKPPIAKKRRAPPPPPPPQKHSSSSSDSEDETQKVKRENPQVVIKQETEAMHSEQPSPWPVVNLERITKVKRRLDVKAQYAVYESFTSSDSEDERIYEEIKEPKLPILSKQESSMVTTDIKPQSSSSSSSESEAEQENYYENIQEVISSNKPPLVMEQEPLWPVVNLVKIPKVNRRLDFKTARPRVDESPSSDSEDELLYVNVKPVQGKVPLGVVSVSKPDSETSSSSDSEDEPEIKVKVSQENLQQTPSPIKAPIAVRPDQESRWPVIDLVKMSKVKRRLDFTQRVNVKVTPVPERIPPGFTVPKPESGTSSSSESEDERDIKVKVNQENLQLPLSPIKPPTTMPASESSSSDSEDEKVKVVQKAESGSFSSSSSEDERVPKEKLHQVVPITKPTAESTWPVIDLGRIPKVKQRLDIKKRVNIKVAPLAERLPSKSIIVPKPDSGTSSSSESEDEREIKEHYQEKIQIVTTPNIQPTESQWPVINLAQVSKVKRRLDIKATAPVVESSSSSDSENERVHVNVTYKKVQEKLPSTPVSVKKPDSGTSSSSDSEDEQKIKIVPKEHLQQIAPTSKLPPTESTWPVIDLSRVPRVKQRLDIKERVNITVTPMVEKVHSTSIKGPNPDSETSSSSDSEDEKEKIQIVTTPDRQPSESQWPAIDLVKQRLDFKERVNVKVPLVPERRPSSNIKIPKQDSGTSSSSESEDEREIKVNQEKMQQTVSPIIPPIALKPQQHSQWPVIDFAKVPKVKRRLNIKTTVPSESSSSDSEDERVQVNVTQMQGKRPSTPDSGTSSSSDSEDEREIKVKVNQEKMQQTVSPIKPPIALKPQQHSQWPVIDFAKVPKVKRRLNIKTTVPSESSSSDSEDERVLVNVTQVQGKRPSTPVSVQKPDSGTSSSSDSEDEPKINIVTKENLQQITPTVPQPSVESQWPVIDLIRMSKVKRRLDIKERVNVKVAPERVPSSIKVLQPESGTSSSSESEDEREIKVKVNQEKMQQTVSPIIPPIALKPHQHSQWPVIDFAKVPKVKRRLNIKTTVPSSESSSSDSEDERVLVNVTQVQGKRPSTPVSVQKPDSGTSSSSDSEDETPRDTGGSDLKTWWPVLDLRHTRKLKKRLDFKVKSASPKLPSGYHSDSGKLNIKETSMQERVPSTKSPTSESSTSSSSESEDERATREMKKDNVLLVTPPIKLPTGESQWPVIDSIRIPKLKRRLDIKEKEHVKVTQGPEILHSASIKVPTSESGTSSSSESEEEQQIKIVNNENLQQIAPATKQPTGESPWPLISLVRIPKVKKRLDVKERAKVTPMQEIRPSTSVKVSNAGSGTSSSSESDDEEKVPSTNITSQKLELGASSSSESEGETIQKVGATGIGSRVEPQTQWPVVDVRGITRIKRRLDFKIPSRSPPLPIPSSEGTRQTLPKDLSSSSSSSDENENAIKSSKISVKQTTRFPSQTSIGLNVKRPSTKPGLNESSSSSDDESDKPKFSSVSVKSQDNVFFNVSPILGIPRSPTKTAQTIDLEKYKVVTDDLRGKSSSGGPSPVVTPELQTKWATMNLGLSRFRKRLDITKTSNPSSPPPISPKQDKQIAGLDMPYTKSVIVTEQVAITPTRGQNVYHHSSSSSSESEDDLKIDGKSSRVEVDFGSPQISLSSIPKVKRSINVTTVQKKSSSSSSSSDEETVNMVVPNLSAGIPRVKRRLDIKGPTPPPSSSSSDDEKVYAHKFSDVTDQRSIEYKRTIMKGSSYDSSSNTQWQSQRELPYVESNTQNPKKLSLDNIKRKLLPSKQNELPPNLRWTSVGSHLSERPAPMPKRHQDGYTSPPPISSPPLMPKQDSSDSSSSSSDDEQKEVKTTLIVTQRTYNPKSVTINTSPTSLNAANFEGRPERRGLTALKTMSSDRKNWESEYETFTESSPVSVDYPPEVQTVYRRTVDAKTKMSQAQSYSVSTSSPATEQRRLAELLYGIPGYKRHVVKSTELPEGPPPPIPSTPLPEDRTDFTWRSPQSSLSRGNLAYYHVQQKTTKEESVDDPFHDNPNISAV